MLIINEAAAVDSIACFFTLSVIGLALFTLSVSLHNVAEASTDSSSEVATSTSADDGGDALCSRGSCVYARMSPRFATHNAQDAPQKNIVTSTHSKRS
eukprot:scaffold149_cov315-Pinguiococcus_pyrenoidosus.AAC.54